MTEEFRAQTKGTTLWKDDVLSLKTQLLWAWVRLPFPSFFLLRSRWN